MADYLKTYGYFSDENVDCSDIFCNSLNIDFIDKEGKKITRSRVKLIHKL